MSQEVNCDCVKGNIDLLDISSGGHGFDGDGVNCGLFRHIKDESVLLSSLPF